MEEDFFEEMMESENSTALEDSKEDDYSDPSSGTIVGLLENDIIKPLLLEKQKKIVGYNPTEIIVVFMGLMFNLLLQKSLKYLLK